MCVQTYPFKRTYLCDLGAFISSGTKAAHPQHQYCNRTTKRLWRCKLAPQWLLYDAIVSTCPQSADAGRRINLVPRRFCCCSNPSLTVRVAAPFRVYHFRPSRVAWSAISLSERYVCTVGADHSFPFATTVSTGSAEHRDRRQNLRHSLSLGVGNQSYRTELIW